MENLSGVTSVPIAWPVSANARKKPLNMEIRVKESQDINAHYRRCGYERTNVRENFL